MTDEEKQLRQECWTKRFYSFGTTKIFEARARSLRVKRQWITFLGLLAPVTVGAFAVSFSIKSEILKYIIIPIAGSVAVIQAVLSLWSLVAKWDESYAYAISSIRNNTKLTSEFEVLAQKKFPEVKKNIQRYRDEYSRLEMDDSSQHITDKEKRYAMRHALFQYKLPCETCGKIPQSLSSTKCDTCGKF